MTNKNTVFRPSASETKAANISKVVKGMIEADTSAREAKTQRLRAARLEREASEKSMAAPKKTSRKSAKKGQSTD